MEIQEKVALKEYSTYRIGGTAEYFCLIKEKKDLTEAIDFAKRNNLEIFFLGGGSNVLFSDNGYSGVIAKIDNDVLEIVEDSSAQVRVRCGAGVTLNKLASFCVKNGFTGLEWSAGIPGTVGGAIRGNAGAFGVEMKDCVLNVSSFNIEAESLKIQEICANDCDFDYRSSIFKEKSNLLVWEVEINLEKGTSDEIKKEMREIIQKRKEGQPSVGEFPSAGCIFKNPVVSKEVIDKFEFDREQKVRNNKVPAGWLIERCDLKGRTIGDAQVSEKQANFIINRGKATSEDVLILISLIKMKVRNKYKVQLEEEVKIIL